MLCRATVIDNEAEVLGCEVLSSAWLADALCWPGVALHVSSGSSTLLPSRPQRVCRCPQVLAMERAELIARLVGMKASPYAGGGRGLDMWTRLHSFATPK